MRRNPLGQSTYLPGETGEFLMRDTVNVKGPPNRSLFYLSRGGGQLSIGSVRLRLRVSVSSRVQLFVGAADGRDADGAGVAGSGTNRIYLRLYYEL